MRDDILLVMCERNGRFIAGALNFIGRDSLFGRYWGCIEDHYCLHFEACYYQAIEFAIANGFARVEAGAQGPHKLARGYMPVATHSLHWIKEPSFREAVRNFLDDETAEVQREIDMLSEMGPFKKSENDAPMTRKLTAEERAESLADLEDSGWTACADRDAIRKTYKFRNFSEAFGWMARTALAAEKIEPPSGVAQRLQHRRSRACHA